jgi:hypothetical protein
MTDIDIATESLERHEHLKEAPEDYHGRRTALLIGVLAAILALSEMAERGAQNAYLAHHITVSDDFAFYQARQARALTLNQTATLLQALGPSSPEVQKAVTDAQAEAHRLTDDSERGNGLKQIQARSEAEGRLRDEALHKYEWLEIVTSALQIAIVLGSVSVVTQLPKIAYLGAAMGAVSAVLAVLVVTGLV